ncbi:hypothetical protein GCM10027343_29070 [Noviherbaspirillum agri]
MQGVARLMRSAVYEGNKAHAQPHCRREQFPSDREIGAAVHCLSNKVGGCVLAGTVAGVTTKICDAVPRAK